MLAKIRTEIATLTPFQQVGILAVLMVSVIAALALLWCFREKNRRGWP